MSNYNKKYENYNFSYIEEKWQKYWLEFGFRGGYIDPINDKKFYTLEMLPYPSGKIHMGHCRNYTIGDATARYRRMCGYDVIYPMGWDAFGLPAENAAIEENSHPKTWTYSNIAHMKHTLQRMGFSYDWDREIVTCSSRYYKHEQKFFLDMFRSGIAYQKDGFVNWDPVDKTVLSNEQVIDGRGWRSGAIVEKKQMKQWYLKITKYAEELLNHQSLDWPDQVKLMQKKWIGKSIGGKILFDISDGSKIEVFTTRPDTIFGASFIAISVEHPLTKELAKSDKSLQDFIAKCADGADNIEIENDREYLGYRTGLTAKHPVLECLHQFKTTIDDFKNIGLNEDEIELVERNLQEYRNVEFLKEYTRYIEGLGCAIDDVYNLPIYVANFVVSDYGTGALFGCPAHDERDYAFAKKYNLPIIAVYPELTDAESRAQNSFLLNNLPSEPAKKVAIKLFEKLNIGSGSVQYKLHDWGISRQRYWGCPVPVIHCSRCGVVAEKDENLPIELPDDIQIDGLGNPLDRHPTWKFVKCPECGGDAERSTDTFDTFFESSWYFLRYLDSTNDKCPFNSNIANKLMPVDVYIGGIEHAILHLLYARFFVKVLRDLNYLNIDEPFKKLISQGMICHKTYQTKSGKWINPVDVVCVDGVLQTESGEIVTEGNSIKMSKSKKNVIDPSEMIEKYGADTIRMFVLSDSPITKDLEWSQSGIESMYKFINRIWKLCLHISVDNVSNEYDFYDINFVNKLPNRDKDLIVFAHKMIKAIIDDYESYSLNTVIAKLYEMYNALSSYVGGGESYNKDIANFMMRNFIHLLHPIAPHITTEIIEIIGIKKMSLPRYSSDCCTNSRVTIAVQINGKTRGKILVDVDSNQELCADLAKKQIRLLSDIAIDRVIFVPNRIINFIVKK